MTFLIIAISGNGVYHGHLDAQEMVEFFVRNDKLELAEIAREWSLKAKMGSALDFPGGWAVVVNKEVEIYKPGDGKGN